MILKKALRMIYYRISALKYILIHLRQDKNSLVEFYLVDAFEIYHFIPYYTELKKRGIEVMFIAEPWEINTAGKWFDQETAIKILKELGMDYCTKCNPKAKVAFTTQYPWNLKRYSNKTKTVSLTYGGSYFKPTSFPLSKEVASEFDFTFVIGNLYKRMIDAFLPKEHTVVTGFPKHDNFLNSGICKSLIKRELGIDTEKQILVWFPTWDEYSSIPLYADLIGKMRKSYYIVSKPHHCTFRLKEKRDDLDKLFRCSDLVVDGNYDFAKCAALADIAICDAKSGAVGEIPYINKDVKLLLMSVNCSDNDFLIDIDKFALVCRNTSQFERLFSEIQKGDVKTENRKKIVEDTYYKDSHQGLLNGVDAILGCL